jgi:hypothetical protein
MLKYFAQGEYDKPLPKEVPPFARRAAEPVRFFKINSAFLNMNLSSMKLTNKYRMELPRSMRGTTATPLSLSTNPY